MVATGAVEHALVVGADVMSSIIDYTDRATCVLFGDGAGAVVLSPAAAGRAGDHRLLHEIDGTGGAGAVHAGGRQPHAGVARDRRRAAALRQAGRPDGVQVRREEEPRKSRCACSSATASRARDLDLFVSHQANRRIIEATAERLGLGPDKVVINLEQVRQHDGRRRFRSRSPTRARQGRLKKGDLVLLASVGAGFTVGSVLLRWSL